MGMRKGCLLSAGGEERGCEGRRRGGYSLASDGDEGWRWMVSGGGRIGEFLLTGGRWECGVAGDEQGMEVPVLLG